MTLKKMQIIRTSRIDDELEISGHVFRIVMSDGSMYTIREEDGCLLLNGDEPFVIEPEAGNQIRIRQPREPS